MKKLIILLLLFSSMFVAAQEDNMPQNVRSAFNAKFPNIDPDDWRLDNNMYYIDFYINDDAYTATFDEKAAWVETAKTISEMNLPGKLQEYLNDKYPDFRIENSEDVTSDKLPEFLRIDLSDDVKVIKIQCDLKGEQVKLLKEELIDQD